jgi:hypothetical protein
MIPFIFYSRQDRNPDRTANVTFEQQAKSLQIVRATLIAGKVVFAGIVLGIAGMPKKMEFGLLEIVLLVMVVQSTVLYMIAPRLVKISQERKDEIRKMNSADKEKALLLFVVPAEVIRGAAMEGPGFLALMMVLIDQSKVGLLVGIAYIFLALLVFPTMSRIRSKVEDLRFRLGL